MDHAFLMGVLHRVAHRDEQRQAVPGGKAVHVAVLCEGNAPHQLHHEVRSAGLLGVHSQLHDLERDSPADRLGLLGDVHYAHSAFPQDLEDAVGTDSLGCLR